MAEEEDPDLIPLRSWTLQEIWTMEHEKENFRIAKALLRKIREVIVTTAGIREFLVSVSSLDPQFATVALQERASTVQSLLQQDLSELDVTTQYEYCWYGGVSGSLCRLLGLQIPRHRLWVYVRVREAQG